MRQLPADQQHRFVAAASVRAETDIPGSVQRNHSGGRVTHRQTGDHFTRRYRYTPSRYGRHRFYQVHIL